MGKATGFMEYDRKTAAERDPLSRQEDWKEYTLPLPEQELKKQGARCMDCATPFCHTGIPINGTDSGCPLYNLIPEWNDLVYRGRWKEALERLLKTNNFPEFTGRVCPAPCEGGCTVAIHDPAVAIKSIEREIIDRGFAEGWIVPTPPTSRTGKEIAIVGSGPAGLAAADQLNKVGHSVTVYERDDRIGGLLMYGIPNMKLEKSLVTRRIELLKAEGVRFVTGVEIGKDRSLADLREDADAIILCAGAQKHRELGLPGQDLTGVYPAMKYLTQSTKALLDSQYEAKIDAEGKDVIVIGGGDTGADCVATALRQKCKSVVQFGRHPRLSEEREESNPWPQMPHVFTMDYAYSEAKARFGADPRRYSVITKKLVSDENGHLKELHTVEADKMVAEDGSYTFREIPGSEKVWPAQLVFVATGFEGTEDALLENSGLHHKRQRISAEYGEYTTNLDGVFAAGDVRRGQSLIVWAIHEGREAARECDRYVMGETNLP
ncbi:glutamate synthase subunit beta [Marininema halotolerans]|uniref:Glutamate synthase (NADPH/NADH) small chain n=1 Tax=Marininema halotolerans TaxID=1155944 RepID=A0A1I6QLC1_9BACL|nr:glutamate synthase subunit beta [Marininema halotolerans]SFS53241.1 glutamate synthase (NADPH/NADH) small chain [Marininema halotolerans]